MAPTMDHCCLPSPTGKMEVQNITAAGSLADSKRILMSVNMSDSIEKFNLFPWNQDFSTGIDAIDQQHQQLVEILNRLARHTVSGLLTKSQLWDLLEELVNYTDYHFKTEEQIWHQEFTGHQLLADHERAHQGFFQKIQSIRDSGEDIEDFINDLFGFLTKWLAFHILESDRRMALATLAVQEGLSLDEALEQAQSRMTGSLSVLIRAILDMYGELSTRAIEMMQQRLGRIRAEEALREAQAQLMDQQMRRGEERYKILFDAIPSSVFVVRCEDFRIMDCNAVAQRLSGRPRELLIGASILDLHPDDERSLISERLDPLRIDGGYHVRFESRVRQGDAKQHNNLIDVEVSVRGPFEQGQEKSLVAIYRDISAIKQHQARLEYVAYHDIPTGLLNRNGIKRALDTCLLNSHPKDLPILLLHLDVDHFSRVNETYGVSVGDAALVAFAERIAQEVPEFAQVGRIGGDEFLILLTGLPGTVPAANFVNTLIQNLQKPIQVGAQYLNLTVSIGANLADAFDGLTSESFLRQTSHASYLAKLQGTSQCRFFDKQEELLVRDRHALIEEVRAAIRRHEFELFYQPKIDMFSGRVVGAEALIRWHHPERGLLNPGAFIPATEGHEVSIELGDWVLETALRQLSLWSAQHPDLVISINISSVEIQSADYARGLIDRLAAWPDVSPSRLQLELLESSTLNSLPTVISNLQKCREIGVAIAIDDFGTGYSSLSYLKRLPLDWLKLDQSFVRDMGESGDDRAIITGVLAISKAYGLKVIAEGVETEEQRSQLVELGCQFGQGYGIGKPMPIGAFHEWLSAWRCASQPSSNDAERSKTTR